MQFHRSLLRSLLFASLLGTLTAGNPASTQADVLALDWSHLSAAYQSGAANATTPQTFTVGSMTATTVFGNTTNAFYGASPIVASYADNTTVYVNGGNVSAYEALQIGIDLTNITTQSVKFTLNFSQAVYGVTFTIFDVDAGTNTAAYVDQIRNILGTDGTNTVQPTLTGSAKNLVYPGNGITSSDGTIVNAVSGAADNAQNSALGNVLVSFSNQTPITSVSFIYGDNQSLTGGGLTTAPTNSGIQVIGLSNVEWATTAGETVPEPDTLATVGLGLASLSAAVLRRRWKA